MTQFAVHKNKNPRTRGAYPYLVDIQSDLMSDLHTRMVAPLAKAPALTKRPIKELTPLVELDGQKFVVLIPQMAGISRADLGAVVGSLLDHRNEIVAAVDFLITGI
jgi:toxin CcdB